MRVRTIAALLLALATISGACSEDVTLSTDENKGVETGGAGGEPVTGGRGGDTGGQSANAGGWDGDGGAQRGVATGEGDPGGAGGVESSTSDEGGVAGTAGGAEGDLPGSGGSGGEGAASPIDRWWRTTNSPRDLIVIENEAITQFRVMVPYEWEGRQCYTDMLTVEPIRIRSNAATFVATSENAPGAAFELTLEFTDGPNGTLHLSELEYEGEATCPGQDAVGHVSISFGARDYDLYIWRKRSGPPIEFAGLGTACLPAGCPLIDGEVPSFCDPDSLSTYWSSPSEICADSDLVQGCTGWQQDEKHCTHYCETDADCANARVPMICNLDCDIGPHVNTCVTSAEQALCW